MWTEEQRVIYRRDESRYPSNLTDAEWGAKVPVLRLEIVKRSDDLKGFAVLPRRWVVERTFSWFGRNRRLAKDYENLAEPSRPSSRWPDPDRDPPTRAIVVF